MDVYLRVIALGSAVFEMLKLKNYMSFYKQFILHNLF
jgi:hypothetical protein